MNKPLDSPIVNHAPSVSDFALPCRSVWVRVGPCFSKLAAFLAALFTTTTLAAEPFQPGITEGPTPWTHTEFVNRSDEFQFLIMSDRTGGERGGIFNLAVDKVNLLQPEFVMSIGDLIDGYTNDQGRTDQQWREFEAMIARLDMPFFRLAGNHDISNQFLYDDWVRRYGQPYYHFLYRDTLFLCLNTEDPPPGGISAAQAGLGGAPRPD